MTDTCKACGSTKVMNDVGVEDQGRDSDGHLKVVVHGDPDAVLFKDSVHSRLLAVVCGDCGYTELRVEKPGPLWAHHQAAQRKRARK